jgi:WD40 repeat protein
MFPSNIKTVAIMLAMLAASAPNLLAEPQAAAVEKACLDFLADQLPPGAIARMGSVRLKPGTPIDFVTFLPGGKTLVCPGWRCIHFWDVSTGKELRRIDVSAGPNELALSPDGTLLAGTCVRTVHLWDTATGKEIRRLQADGQLVFSHDGRKILAGNGRTLQLWETASGKAIGKLIVPPSGLSHDAFAFGADDRAVVTLQANEILFTDLFSGKEIRRLKVDSRSIAEPVFSANGNWLAVSGEKNAIHIIDLQAGQEIRKLDNRFGIPVGFTPDNQHFLSASHEGVIFWKVATGKEARRFPNIGIPVSVALSPDGKFLAQGYPWRYGLHLWDVETGRELHCHPGHPGPASRIAFSPDGKALVSRSDEEKTLRFWETDTGRPIRVLSSDIPEKRADAGWGCAIAYSPDGRSIALGDLSGIVRIWDTREGKQVRRLEIDVACRAINAVSFSPDGRTLAVSGARAKYHTTQWPGCITVFDLATGDSVLKQPLPCTPRSCVFSADNRLLAIADEDNRFWLWDLSRNRAGLVLENRGHLFHPAFSPDGRFVTTTTSADSGAENEWILHLWELATGREALRLGIDDWKVCLLSNGLLAAGSDKTIRLWSLATGKPVAHFRGHRVPTTCLAFSPDGKRLATGLADATTLIWDVESASRQVAMLTQPLKSNDMSHLYEQLGHADASPAYTAVWAFVTQSDKSVAFLKNHLRPANDEKLKRLPGLIADLDSSEFAARNVAAKELEKLLPDAEPALRQALAGKVSPEQRRRIEALLALPPAIVRDAEVLRGIRAVQALEYIGTAEAQQVLQSLAKGPPQARLTKEAAESLERQKGKSNRK